MGQARIIVTFVALLMSMMASGSLAARSTSADVGPCRACADMAPYAQASGLSFDFLPN